MTLNVNIDIGYEFEVNANADEVFDLLSDIPTSAGFFPHVDKLVHLEAGAYRWEMEKVAVGQINLQTIYASQYVANRPDGTVTWTPIEGEGNALVSGYWKITDNKTSTHIKLQITGDLTLPLPGLMKMMVAPVVESKFEKLIQKYIANLTQRLGGKA